MAPHHSHDKNMSRLIAVRHNAKGPGLCAVTACATAAHTVGEAMYAIKRGEADVILAGGSSAITPVGVAGLLP